MMNYFLKNFSDNVPYSLSQAEILQTESIADSKYRTWEWNWAYGPEYTFKNSFEINHSFHSCRLFVKEGIIRESTIAGSDQMKRTSEKLVGCRHMINDLSEFFKKEDIFLTREEIYNFF
jgi:lipoate-protein ligase A